MSQPVPGNLPDLTIAEQMKKTETFIGDPQIPRNVLSDGKDRSAGNAIYGNKPVILQIAEFENCRDPDSPTSILKKRIRVQSIEFAVWFAVVGAEMFNLPTTQSVQATNSAQPNAAIPGR